MRALLFVLTLTACDAGQERRIDEITNHRFHCVHGDYYRSLCVDVLTDRHYICYSAEGRSPIICQPATAIEDIIDPTVNIRWAK